MKCLEFYSNEQKVEEYPWLRDCRIIGKDIIVPAKRLLRVPDDYSKFLLDIDCNTLYVKYTQTPMVGCCKVDEKVALNVYKYGADMIETKGIDHTIRCVSCRNFERTFHEEPAVFKISFNEFLLPLYSITEIFGDRSEFCVYPKDVIKCELLSIRDDISLNPGMDTLPSSVTDLSKLIIRVEPSCISENREYQYISYARRELESGQEPHMRHKYFIDPTTSEVTLVLYR